MNACRKGREGEKERIIKREREKLSVIDRM
jgi:hypothetical protein